MPDLVAYPRPLRKEALTAVVPEGTTVLEAVGPNLPEHFAVLLNGEELPREAFAEHVLKEGDQLLVVAKMHGDSFEEILAVVVLSAVAIGSFAASAAMAESLGMSGFTAKLFTSVVGSVFYAFGSNLVMSIFGFSQQDQRETTPIERHKSLTGARNRMAPYAPIPRLHGEVRYYPPLAANYHTEIQGNDQYLRMLLCLGYGPLEIGGLTVSSTNTLTHTSGIPSGYIKIGDTDISLYSDVEYEIGTFSNLTLYTQDIQETNPSTALDLQSTSGTGWVTDNYSVTRTTATNVTDISVDLTFPSGIWSMDDAGNIQSATVEFRIEYSPVGANTWTTVVDPWVISAAKKETLRKSYHWTVSKGQYDVRITRIRTYVPNRKAIYTNAAWTALRGTRSTAAWNDPVGSPDVILMALRIKASDQLNGVVDQLSVQAKSLLQEYTGTNLIADGDISAFTGWNETDGDNSAAVKQDDGFWRVQLTNPDTGNANIEFYMNKTYSVTDGATYVEEFLLRTNGTLNSLAVSFYTANGHHIVTPTITDLDGDVFLVRAEYTAETGATYIRAVDIVNVSISGGTYLEIKRPRLYDKSTEGWKSVATSNPAWALYDALTGSYIDTPVPASRVDRNAIYEWAAWCDANNIEYNFVNDSKETLIQRAAAIAATGFAQLSVRDGLFTVIRESRTKTPVQVITPRNAWGLRAEKTFKSLPHALRVKYVDRNVWEEDEIIVYRNGYDATNATRFEDLDTRGVTNQQQAWKVGQFALRLSELRPETYTVNMDYENLIATRGDLVRLSYDTIMVGLKWGRIKSVTTDANNNATAITVDEECIFESDKSYAVRIRLQDNSTVVERVTGSVGANTTLTFVNPITNNPINVGDLFVFGEADKETIDCIVTGIEYNPDLSAKLYLADAARTLLDFGTPPAYNPQVTIPTQIEDLEPAAPDIDYIISDESVLYRDADGSVKSAVVFGFTSPSNNKVPIDKVELRYRIQPTTTWLKAEAPFEDGAIRITEGIETGVVVEYQVRSVSPWGRYSSWSATATHTVIGKSLPPADVTGFTWTTDKSNIILSWSEVPDLDVDRYELRIGGSDWNGGAVLGTIQGTTYIDAPRNVGTHIYRIKAIDTAGNYSTNSTDLPVTITAPSAPALTARVEADLIKLSWTAATDGTFATKEYEIRLGGTDWDSATFVGKTDSTDFIYAADTTLSYTFRIKAIDIAGNYSATDSTVNVSATAPGSFTLNVNVVDETLRLSWTEPSSGTYPIDHYEIRVGGTDWDTATFVANVKSTEFIYKTVSIGTTTFRIKAVDTIGLQSQEVTNTFTVNALQAVSISAQVIDNFVLLKWTEATGGTFPVKEYELRKGDTYATSTIIGTTQGRFSTIFEDTSGAFTYWVTPIDIAGNAGTEASVTPFVSEPPDYVLRDDYYDDWTGAKTNVYVDTITNTAIPGANTAETYEQHFVSNGWNSPQDQVNAGYSYWLEPMLTTASYQFTYDYGTILPATKVTVTLPASTVDQARTNTVTIETSSDGVTYTSFPAGSTSIFDSDFRYVRVTGDSSGSAHGLEVWQPINLKIDAKLRTSEGSGTHPAVGYALSLPGASTAYASIAMFNYAATTYNAMSLSAWVRCRGTQGVLVGFDRDNYWSLSYGNVYANGNAAGELQFSVTLTGGVTKDYRTGVLINDGNFHFVECYFDNGKVTVKIDGKTYVDVTETTTTFGTGVTRYGFIGDDSAATTENGTRNGFATDADIDELRLYHRVLTATESKQLFERSGNPVSTNIVFHHKFDEGAGVSAADSSGNGYTATLYGAAGWTADAAPVGVLFTTSFVDVTSIIVTPKLNQAMSAVYDFYDVLNPVGFLVYLYDTNGNRVSGEFSWTARGY